MGVNHKRNNISLIAVNLHLGYSGGQLRENLYTGGVCISKILNFKSKILSQISGQIYVLITVSQI